MNGGGVAYLVGIGLTIVGLTVWRIRGIPKRHLALHPAEGFAMAILAIAWPLTIAILLLAWFADWALRTISRAGR